MNFSEEELKNMTYREYMAMLYIEFCKTQGIDYEKTGMFTYESLFISWIANNAKIKEKYTDLLIYLISNSVLIGELGKGRYDSLVPNLNMKGYESISVSPYVSTFEEGSVVGYDGKVRCHENLGAIIKYENPRDQFRAPNINPFFETESIDTLVTQLPVANVSLNPLIESSRHYNDVVIGAYGSIEDKDMKEKIAKLRDIKEAIESMYYMSCEEEYVRENGSYLYVLKSKQKTLTLEKVRTR